MYFTQEDYKKIENWLHRNSVKDTEFQEALPFTGKEIVTVVQDGHNRKVNIQEFINQLYKHGVEDFLNVTNTYRANNITLKEAIRLIPAEARKEGQVITFLNTEGNWEIYQFIGKLNQWNNPTLWNNPFDWEKLVVDSILPDEEDLTKSAPDAKGNSYLSLKNRKYEPDKYSGLGRKILRKRVVEIEDPIYGTQEKNLLLQADFAEDNTVYVVRYDFTLNGQDITLPDNSYIEYEGGSISDGNIIDSAGGLNRIVLKKNIVNGKNILTQEMINKPNTIYEIRYDFDLNGEEITIPEGCVLDFNGGSISGSHTLTGSNTGIRAGLVKIFSTDVTLAGTWNVVEAYPEWFGAKGDGATDDRIYIQRVLDSDFNTIVFNNNYLIKNAPYDYSGYNLNWGELDYASDMYNQYSAGFTATPIVITKEHTIVINGTIKQYSPLCNLINVETKIQIKGNGKIEGCGLVNSANFNFQGVSPWNATLIEINASNCSVEGISIVNPVRDGIFIKSNKRGTYINNCVFGGGLISHTKGNYTHLMGVCIYGEETNITNCRFVPINGKSLYSGVYCYSIVDYRISCNIVNNLFDGCLEHGVYNYGQNTIINQNSFSDIRNTAIQCFAFDYIISNNSILCNPTMDFSENAIMTAGYGLIKNNNIYNCAKIAIRSLTTYNDPTAKEAQVGSSIIGNRINKRNDISNDNYSVPAINVTVIGGTILKESILIKDNVIKNSENTYSTRNLGDIQVLINSNATVDKVNIIGNTIYDSPTCGILVKSMTYNVFDCIIDSNSIYENGSVTANASIRLENVSAILSKNYCKRTGLDANALQLVSTNMIVCTDNIFLCKYYGSTPSSRNAYRLLKVIDNGNYIIDEYSNGGDSGFLRYRRGTSTSRPSNVQVGFQFFDKTLGKPIYAKTVAENGTVTWVDATGADV